MAYITPAEARQYIGGISGEGDDALFDTIIAAVEAFIESYTNRDFKADSDTTRYFDPSRDAVGPVLYLDRDLCSITSITNGDEDVLTTAEYVTEPRNDTPYYAIRLLSSSGLYWTYDEDPENAITIVGKWGYSTTPPADILMVCRDIVKQVYRSRDANSETTILAGGVVITPNNIPRLSLETLNRYRRT